MPTIKKLDLAVAILLSIVTCGIYGYVWAYKMGDAYDRLDQRAANTGVIYLVLSLLGLSIVTYALLQDQINKHLPTDPTNPSLQPPTDSAP